MNQNFYNEITQEDLQNLNESKNQISEKGPWQEYSKMTPVIPPSGSLGLVTGYGLDSGLTSNKDNVKKWQCGFSNTVIKTHLFNVSWKMVLAMSAQPVEETPCGQELRVQSPEHLDPQLPEGLESRNTLPCPRQATTHRH